MSGPPTTPPGGPTVFPAWLRELDGPTRRADAVAGATTAVLLVPQAIAYAALAGLPPTAGLYAATLPLLVYALLGSSRHLSVGPVAIDSMMVAAALAPAVAAGHDALPRAAMLALLVGGMQAIAGALRLGGLVGLLSRPVVSAFLSAAALTIAGTQIGPLLGLSIPTGGGGHALVMALLAALPRASLPTVLMGLSALALLLAQRRWWPRFPGALVVIVGGAVGMWALDLGALGVARVGTLPTGLPRPAWPAVPASELRGLAIAAAPIALISYLEAISSAQAFATRHRYTIAPARELVALGASNAAAGLVGGYPIAGGLSRSAVHASAGARTQAAAAFTALLVVAALLVGGPALAWIPKAALAAIVLSAVVSLVDLGMPLRLLRLNKTDALAWGVTFVTTLEVGPGLGVGVGVLASLVAFQLRSMRPHVAVEGRKPATDEYRNVLRHPDVVLPADVAVLRVDASLYFGNTTWVREAIHAVHAQGSRPACAIVLDCSAVNDLDASALDMLDEVRSELAASGTRLVLARVKGPVLDVLRRSEVLSRLGPDAVFETVHEAVTRYGHDPEAKVCDRPATRPVPGTLAPKLPGAAP